MSFITKRERVFNEYDLFDLPPRNEGKLKAYASCTDARAWSHFCSDKTEHLVEIIKRNNEMCHPKYVPTDVIVQTLMVAKNAEIGRLKRKIEEFEQMLAVYDQLELTCDQKCEIAKAHAAIKAANKELNELCLDLDLSGFTEGIESDAFETGKSRGDESMQSQGGDWDFEKDTPRKDNKSNQTGLVCPCDAYTMAVDPRIQEMQETIINKDAQLSAKQNTIAVMENDVCEPYCIYAHIYTALEKIFGVLCQNDKYKLYLNLMTAGKDIRCIDIKGKILYKLKVLEKFSTALIAPCTQDGGSQATLDCACLRAEVIARIDFPQAPTTDIKKPVLDNKRAQLVADIMDNEEMKDILSKDNSLEKNEDEQSDDGLDNYSIDSENLKRLKKLQENYEDLMTCYEKVKHEKENLLIRCNKYEELEKEFENLKLQLLEYNALWNEKEHYRKRSMDIDLLKEQYLVLADETSNLETRLKAESEINVIKTNTIEDLRNENIALEKKLNDALIAFEKEKNAVECKLKETECTVMCQEQQVKSLSVQIDRLLEQGLDSKQEDSGNSLMLLNEVESLKEQLQNLKDALYCSEEEKQAMQEDFENKISIINDLRIEIDNWKSSYEKEARRNDYLEKYSQEEIQKLLEENKCLAEDVHEKSEAIENLRNVINSRSHEVETLMNEIEKKDDERNILSKQLQTLKESYNQNVRSVETEKEKELEFIHLARRESQELLEKINNYNAPSNTNISIVDATKSYKYITDFEAGTSTKLPDRESNHLEILNEIRKLREVNSHAINNFNRLKSSLDLTKKDSEILEHKLLEYQYASKEIGVLRDAHDSLIKEKIQLECDLKHKKNELETALQSIQFSRKESEELLAKLEHFKVLEDELVKLKDAYQHLLHEKQDLQKQLSEKTNDLQQLINTFSEKNEDLLNSSQRVTALEKEIEDIKTQHVDLLADNNELKRILESKTEDLNKMRNKLESTMAENRELFEKIKSLEALQSSANDNISTLENENIITKTTLDAIKNESASLIDKLKQFESLENEYQKLKDENERMKMELNNLTAAVKRIEDENRHLKNENQSLHGINEDLEKSLIEARNQLIAKPGSHVTYEDVLLDLESMKKEKIQNHNKIKDLLNKLNESDIIILDLNNDLLARNDKIAILENHINELEDEIRNLHKNLNTAIDTGEDISVNSFEKYESSLKGLEARHSKAAHNIKMDVANLQNELKILEQQLSASKLKSEQSSVEKNKYHSQVGDLQNERIVIVKGIQELEKKSMGNSALSPEQCGIEEILDSLNRISENLDVKNSLVLNVQTSSKVLLSKADEAKKLVEKEKQKILTEKEEAIQEKAKMEKMFVELRTKLENEKAHDEEIIKDLEANLLNQELISQNAISKLKSELKNLQSLYQDSISKVDKLQEKIRSLSNDNSSYKDDNNKLIAELQQKTEVMSALQKDIDFIRKRTYSDSEVQVPLSVKINVYCQTENLEEYHTADKNDKEEKLDVPQTNVLLSTRQVENKFVSNILPKQTKHSLNEVQILAASVEPSFDFVKNSYLNYKIPRLGPGKLEQYSISTGESSGPTSDTQNRNLGFEEESLILDNSSFHSDSSKMTNKKFNKLFSTKLDSPNSSENPAFDLGEKNTKNQKKVINRGEVSSNKENKHSIDKHVEQPLNRLTDEELLVIYKDGQSSNDKNYTFKRKANPNTDHSNNKYEKQPPKDIKRKEILKHHQKINTHLHDTYLEKEDPGEDDSVKPKLKINVPRVENDNLSIFTTSDFDKKSLDSNNKSNSLTNVKLYSDMEIKTLKTETPSMPTISNEYNLDSRDFLGLESENIGGVLRYDGTKTIYYTNNGRSSGQSSNKTKHFENDLLKQGQNLSDEIKLSSRTAYPDTSQHKLSRVDGDAHLVKRKSELKSKPRDHKLQMSSNFALDYMLDSLQREDPNNTNNVIKTPRKSKSDKRLQPPNIRDSGKTVSSIQHPSMSSFEYKSVSPVGKGSESIDSQKTKEDKNIIAQVHDIMNYEEKLNFLTKSLEFTEKDYKRKLQAIKTQYDSNIKNIINEHNQGVKNIQGLHEDTLQDIIKSHENEIEIFRTISIEANRKAEKLEKENWSLKSIIQDNSSTVLDEEPTKISPDAKKYRKSHVDSKTLTKTNVVACNVKPKGRTHGPCTCSLDVNISDTIRNIFEQVDVEQRKMAEFTYIKYIANKILFGNVEALDAQELSFLHLKVCRTWKMKLSKEEALQKRINSLESELLNRQRHAQEHIAELDRKVEEEKRRLQEVREKICQNSPTVSRTASPESTRLTVNPAQSSATTEKEIMCSCNTGVCGIEFTERGSAGDLPPGLPAAPLRPKRARTENNRAVSTKMDERERKDKKLYNDEPPTRLRRSHERAGTRLHKK